MGLVATVGKRALALGACAFWIGCAAPASDQGESSDALVDDGEDVPFVYATDGLKSAEYDWDAIVLQDVPEFSGSVFFASAHDAAAPSYALIVDKESGMVVIARHADAPPMSAETIDELGYEADVAGRSAFQLAGEPGGTRLASFVTDDNKCFLKLTGMVLVAVAAGKVAIVARAAAAAAPAIASNTMARIAAEGVKRVIATQGRQALASPAVRKYLAMKPVQWSVEGWLYFTESGQKVLAPVVRDVKAVANAECRLDGAAEMGGTFSLEAP